VRILVLGCKDYPAFATPWVHSGGMEVYTERMIHSLADRARFTVYTAGGRSDGDATVEVLGGATGLRTQPLSLLLRSWPRVRRSAREFDVLNPQTPLAAVSALRVNRLFGVPYVITVHIFGADPAHAGGRLNAFVYSFIERLVFSRAKAIIPTGRRLAAALKKRYAGIGSRISVVTAAAEGVKHTLPREEVRSRLGFEPDDELLLFLGRVVQENGIENLMAAFAILRQNRPRLHMMIAGAGDREEEVAKRIESNSWKGCVRMIGSVRGQEKLDLLAAADLMVRTSRHEVFPEAYLEALSVGTPVAATPAGDTPDLAAESEAIELLPFDDAAEQARILAALLDDVPRRRAMRERALDYSRRVVWNTQKEHYWSVLQRAAGGRA